MEPTTPPPTRSRRGYKGLARKLFRRAAWITGQGPFASVSFCGGVVTVELHRTLETAHEARAAIDDSDCGGSCRGWRGHAVFDISSGRRVFIRRPTPPVQPEPRSRRVSTQDILDRRRRRDEVDELDDFVLVGLGKPPATDAMPPGQEP